MLVRRGGQHLFLRTEQEALVVAKVHFERRVAPETLHALHCTLDQLLALGRAHQPAEFCDVLGLHAGYLHVGMADIIGQLFGAWRERQLSGFFDERVHVLALQLLELVVLFHNRLALFLQRVVALELQGGVRVV